MSTYVKPTSDLFIRYLLGSEENKDLLLDFINSHLTDEGFTPAVSITIQNPFNLKELPNAKESILDVKARDEAGRIFDVEIQVISSPYYTKRSLYYWAKVYESQLKESEFYSKLNPVICINILDFTLFGDIKKSHTCFMPSEIREPEYVLSDDMQIHFLELPKVDFTGKPQLKTSLDRWIYFLKNEGSVKEEEEMKILLTNDTIMEKAHNAYKEFTANDRLVEQNEARMKRIRDEASRMEGAREEGIAQGMEKGIEKGLEQGEEQGIEKGLKQGISKAKKEDAKRMLEKGYPVEDIQKITGLSRTQIEALKDT